MAVPNYSRRAEADLLSIGDYTLRTWGEEQASRYLDDLESCCERLADNPHLGRACDDILPGLYRFESGKHVIFYRIKPDGTFISRILHEKMLPEKHEYDE